MTEPPIDLPGAKEIIDWFGYFPVFHDAYLLDIRLAMSGTSSLRIHGFRMTEELDANGYFILDRHAVVTIFLEDIRDIRLTQFRNIGIIGFLEIERGEKYTKIEWDSSYGVSGAICAKRVRFELQPGKPDAE